MRIYIAHPTSIDYKKEIYEPLRNDDFFLEHELVLPHEESVDIHNSREDYKSYDVVIAECSEPSIGVGIELGWFYDDKKLIYCFVKSGVNPSSAISSIAEEIINYNNKKDFVERAKGIIKKKLPRSAHTAPCKNFDTCIISN